ncbi:NifB/NifX family molybdenum-iron cluster-binding protein [Clostridium sp. Marseille-P2415]|uniref:NifB/NifX family molybdenum-iron cluster-binding protein n=1 Tax=Clostridium sp. Marseille-P2415 TaxID=1805471 RepID=UPI00098850A5|nr:NifB/NifX family molybdenum-iron cluster-binding protein [Clostridium sp. Marseille-P2415]
MRVAVTYNNGLVFQHYGKTERFKVYDIEDNKIVTAAVVNTDGSGHGALAGILKKISVDTLICGGIGAGAKESLNEADIKLYGGVSGDADEAVKALLSGTLQYDQNVTCTHEHHNDHNGHHDCGEQNHHC